MFRFFEWPGMEIQVLPHVLAPEGQFLADILGYVEGCCHRVLDRAQGAEAEFLLIVRPVHVITVYQVPRLRAAEPPEDPVREPGEEAVDVPRAVLMVLRDKEILHLRAVGFALVPDELGELLLVLVQIVTVEFGFIQSTTEAEPETLPGRTPRSAWRHSTAPYPGHGDSPGPERL